MATLKDFLKKFNMDSLSIDAGFLKATISFKDADKSAAWEMYIELLTRVSTQHLEPSHGDEKTALTSIFSLFNITRDVIKRNGKECIEFTKIAIVVLNQVIRPFTAKWHKLSLEGAFTEVEKCKLFRQELSELQHNLGNYTTMLAEMAAVEDLTKFEKN